MSNGPSDAEKQLVKRLFAGIAVILLVAVMVYGGVYTVDQGERAVVTRNGEVNGEAGPGLNFKIPFVDAVHKYDVRSQAYTMAATSGEGSGDEAERVNRDDAIDALSSEGMELEIDVTVRYHVDDGQITETYSNIGTNNKQLVEKIVRPTARESVRACAGNFKGLEMYSTARAEFQQCIVDDMGAEFEANNLVLEAVQIRNIELPSSVTQAINEKQAAEKRVEQKQAEIEIAKKEKERQIIQAEAEAEQIQITGEALRENPEVLELRYIEALKEGNTIYVPSDGGLTLTKEADETNSSDGGN